VDAFLKSEILEKPGQKGKKSTHIFSSRIHKTHQKEGGGKYK
jgi:hypothetical protein